MCVCVRVFVCTNIHCRDILPHTPSKVTVYVSVYACMYACVCVHEHDPLYFQSNRLPGVRAESVNESCYWCGVLKRVAACCSVLQSGAACCRVLQRVAAFCSV